MEHFTVRQLIELLQTFPPDTIVRYCDASGYGGFEIEPANVHYDGDEKTVYLFCDL